MRSKRFIPESERFVESAWTGSSRLMFHGLILLRSLLDMSRRRHELTEAEFLKDVAKHKMTIVRDDGLFRSIRLEQPKSNNLWFDITTWPGFLCISGDAGCYVFTRLRDMFEFFRGSGSPSKGSLEINPDYWSQKVEAIDRCSGLKEYCAETFRENVRDWLNSYEASNSLRKVVEAEVISRADDGEHEAVKAAMNFEFEGEYPMQDFYEYSYKEFTHRFLWSCYAIAWAIQCYDASKVEIVASSDGLHSISAAS